MAYVLLNSQFEQGLQGNTALILQSLRHISLVSPFNIVDVRTQLEASQMQPFDDAGFLSFLVQIYSLNLDYSLLTSSEETIFNVIREYIEPNPNLACCGSDPATALNVVAQYNDRVGSLTWEKEVRFLLDNTVDCNIFDILLTIVQQVGAPAPVSSPLVCGALGCVTNKNTFSHLWLDFVGDPSGGNYDVSYEFRDSTGLVLYTIVTVVSF